MRSWIWRHFHLDLPEDWEMLQFSRHPKTGRCVFADRYDMRLEFSWTRGEQPPDFDRMLTDYLRKLRDQDQLKAARRIQHGAWSGIHGRQGDARVTRFGRYFSEQACLIEIVLLWTGRMDEQLKNRILDSIREEPQQGSLQRWRAFGMDLLADERLTLSSCKIEPARAEMRFAEEKAQITSETFQRLGMVPHWLRGTVRQYMVSKEPASVSSRVQSFKDVADHQIEFLAGQQPTKLLSRWRYGRRQYRAAGWICPRDGRLYRAETLRPSRDDAEECDLAGGRLSCCEDLAAAVRSAVMGVAV